MCRNCEKQNGSAQARVWAIRVAADRDALERIGRHSDECHGGFIIPTCGECILLAADVGVDLTFRMT